MKKALAPYLADLPVDQREQFARSCGTTLGYLRKAMSAGHRLGESLCINLERESNGAIRCESLRPDVDWAYLRGSVEVSALAEASEGASIMHERGPSRPTHPWSADV